MKGCQTEEKNTRGLPAIVPAPRMARLHGNCCGNARYDRGSTGFGLKRVPTLTEILD